MNNNNDRNAIIIQKYFRGYLGRLESARILLLNERNKLKSKELKRKNQINQSMNKFINKSNDNINKISPKFDDDISIDELEDSLDRVHDIVEYLNDLTDIVNNNSTDRYIDDNVDDNIDNDDYDPLNDSLEYKRSNPLAISTNNSKSLTINENQSIVRHINQRQTIPSNISNLTFKDSPSLNEITINSIDKTISPSSTSSKLFNNSMIETINNLTDSLDSKQINNIVIPESNDLNKPLVAKINRNKQVKHSPTDDNTIHPLVAKFIRPNSVTNNSLNLLDSLNVNKESQNLSKGKNVDRNNFMNKQIESPMDVETNKLFNAFELNNVAVDRQKSVNRPIDKLANNHIDEPAVKRLNDPKDKQLQLDQQIVKPIVRPIDKPIDNPVDNKIRKPIATLTEGQIRNSPAGIQIRNAVGRQIHIPVDKPIDYSADIQIRKAIDNLMEEPIRNSPAGIQKRNAVGRQINIPIDKPRDKPIERPLVRPVDIPSDKKVNKRIDKNVNKQIEAKSEDKKINTTSYSIDSTIQLQEKEIKLLIELADIEKRQHKKLIDIRNLLEYKQIDNKKSDTQNDKKIDNQVNTEINKRISKLEDKQVDNKRDKHRDKQVDKQVDKPRHRIKKEDIHHDKLIDKQNDQKLTENQVDKHIDKRKDKQIENQLVKQIEKQMDNQIIENKSKLTNDNNRYISPPANPRQAFAINDNATNGYLVEYNKKIRAVSADKSTSKNNRFRNDLNIDNISMNSQQKSNISNQKYSKSTNEDRYFISLNHKNEGFNNIASFGVFDGHNGSRSAQFCSDNIHKLILKSFHNLLIKYQDHELISNQEFFDGLLCQAIKDICINTDNYLKDFTRSGSTLNSLFLIYNPLDQSINIYNANIGDSRCVMINYNQKYINTSTNSSTYNSSSNSLNQIAPMNKVHFEKDISDSKHSVGTYITSSIDSIDQSFHNITSSITNKSIKIKREANCTALSDDHSLLLLRERSRLVNRSTIYSDVLPNYIDSYTGASINRSNDIENVLNQLFDNEVIIESDEQKSANFTSLLDNYNDNYPSDDESELSNLPIKSMKTDKINQSIKLVREESFITNRKGIDGRVGPEAIFSRYNVSIMMTRSLGDRYGPRSCIGLPDIKSSNIPSNQFTRLIIASDGLFDVVTNNQIKLSALKSKYKDPNVYAKHLVNKAIRYRNNQGLRLDDITVLCIDIHSNHYKSINNDNGIDIYKFKNNLILDMNEISNDNNIVIDNNCAPGCTMQ